MNDEKGSTSISPFVWTAVGIFATVLIFGWVINTIVGGDWSKSGTFGDTFGALNTLFSGLAFAGLIYTIYLQRQELRLQRQELAETREVLKKQHYELAQQSRLLARQQFETTLFQLIEQYKLTKGRTGEQNLYGASYFDQIVKEIRYSWSHVQTPGYVGFPEPELPKLNYFQNYPEGTSITGAAIQINDVPMGITREYITILNLLESFISKSLFASEDLYINLVNIHIEGPEVVAFIALSHNLRTQNIVKTFNLVHRLDSELILELEKIYTLRFLTTLRDEYKNRQK